MQCYRLYSGWSSHKAVVSFLLIKTLFQNYCLTVIYYLFNREQSEQCYNTIIVCLNLSIWNFMFFWTKVDCATKIRFGLIGNWVKLSCIQNRAGWERVHAQSYRQLWRDLCSHVSKTEQNSTWVREFVWDKKLDGFPQINGISGK